MGKNCSLSKLKKYNLKKLFIILIFYYFSYAHQLNKEEYIHKKKFHSSFNNYNGTNKITKNNFDYNYNNFYDFYGCLALNNNNSDFDYNNFLCNLNNQEKNNKTTSNNNDSNNNNLINFPLLGNTNSNNNSQHSQGSNSSHFSTASEDGQNLRENDLNELIKKGIKKISNYYNINKNKKNNISLSCNYYCNLINEKENEYNLQIQIKDLIENFKENEKF